MCSPCFFAALAVATSPSAWNKPPAHEVIKYGIGCSCPRMVVRRSMSAFRPREAPRGAAPRRYTRRIGAERARRRCLPRGSRRPWHARASLPSSAGPRCSSSAHPPLRRAVEHRHHDRPAAAGDRWTISTNVDMNFASSSCRPQPWRRLLSSLRARAASSRPRRAWPLPAPCAPLHGRQSAASESSGMG